MNGSELLVASSGISVFFHQYFDFQIISDNFSYILKGFGQTLELSIIAGALSLIWGLVLALLRQLPGRPFLPVRIATISYIDIFRGIPLLLVLLIVDGSIPFLTFLPREVRIPEWFGKPDPFWYGVFAITITYGAYMAEVYRAGIEAVPRGQMEAARSLGMSHGQAMRHVIVPQAVRKVIPPLLNDFIALMKDTSLVGVIALVEVVEAGRTVQGNTFNSSGYTLGAVFFVIVTVPLARLVDRLIAREQGRVERGAPSVAGPPSAPTTPIG
jgi:polar amino acid transport system permease protein